MSTQVLDPVQETFLQGRHIATLATENPDGTIHMTAVWYLYEDRRLFIATSSKTRKAQNLAARPKASLMVDLRRAGNERGLTAAGTVHLISGSEAQAINERIHRRYLSSAAMSDRQIGPAFGAFDDIAIQLTPTSWIAWDMATLDAQAFGGRLAGTPGFMLPLD